ncbi:MAG: PKD domain-containing protein [Methanotrichaceae archaeon]|nr:PKD domain-containing protein [Methanotrichaceae archaeon]
MDKPRMVNLIIAIGLLLALSGIGYGQEVSKKISVEKDLNEDINATTPDEIVNLNQVSSALIDVVPNQIQTVTCYVIQGMNGTETYDIDEQSLNETAQASQNCGCQKSVKGAIQVNDPPTCEIFAPPEVCKGSVGNVAHVLYQTGATYLWSISNGEITKGQLTPRIEFSVYDESEVIIGVKITKTYASGSGTTVCKCINSLSIPTEENTGCEISVSSSKVCAGSVNNKASVPLQPGATYLWKVIGGKITKGQRGNEMHWTAGTASGTATISVTVGKATGYKQSLCTCSKSTKVTINPEPKCKIVAPSSVCEGSIAEASVPDAGKKATYDWSITNGNFSGQGERKIHFTANTAGTQVVLHVKVTNSHGCTCSS